MGTGQESISWVEALYRAVADFARRERVTGAAVRITLDDGEAFFLASCESVSNGMISLSPYSTDNSGKREGRAVLVHIDGLKKVEIILQGPGPFPLQAAQLASPAVPAAAA